MRVVLTDNNYKPTINQIVEEIWNMDEEEQLELLNALNYVSDAYHIAMQMQSIKDKNDECPSLYKNSRIFVSRLNDYLNDEDTLSRKIYAILLEGESTNIGREVTIERIKEVFLAR